MRTILLASAAIIGLTGCSSERSGTITTEDGETSYKVDPGTGDVSMNVTGPDGEQMTLNSGSDVAADLPDGFTVYPGAKVVSSAVINQGDGKSAIIAMTTSDSAEKMTAFYRSQAEAAGVKISTELNDGNTRMIAGEGANGIGLTFTTNVSGEGTSGQLMIGEGIGG